MTGTSDELRQKLARFVDTDFPPEMQITKRFQDTIQSTDYHLGDPDGSRDSLLVMLLMSVVELESKLRGPVSRRVVADLRDEGL